MRIPVVDTRTGKNRKWNAAFSPVQVSKDHLYGLLREMGLTYGLCTVGGFDRKKQTISLHAYRTNQRQTQGAKVEDCRICTWMAFRSWLVSLNSKKGGVACPPAP